MNEEKTVTYNCVQWLNKVKDEIAAIKDTSPFLAVLGIVNCIEFLGRLCCQEAINDTNHCEAKFEAASAEFESLKKYKDHNIYRNVRCGLDHAISPQNGLKLTKDNDVFTNLDTNPIVLNVNTLFKDFALALEYATKNNSLKNQDALKDYIIVINSTSTASTANNESIKK